jgi:hypothetical protein
MKNLESRGFSARYFDTAAAAADYLVGQITDTTVGIGGSKTVEELGLFERLSARNTVYWHWKSQEEDVRDRENAAAVFLSSANAISEDGEILNIDGGGNRLAGLVYGKKRTYLIAGTNKLCPDFHAALDRARNVAAVKNARRFQVNTPCQKDGRCHDCRCKERICSALLVLWQPPKGMEVEVVLIGEALGY